MLNWTEKAKNDSPNFELKFFHLSNHLLQAVINGVMQGRDQLVVMATGGGKSLCYQVPPLALNMAAIVISPLISLMQDQVMALDARGIRACYLGSAQSDRQVEVDAWAGKYSFIYITPELAMNRLRALSDLRSRVGLALVAVDEAHCVSEWGLDFRPEYRQLADLRRHLTGVPFLALTATATPQVRDDIVRNLQLDTASLDCWVQSFERPNLKFEVSRKSGSMASSLQPLIEEIAAQAEQSGGLVEPTIVYTVTRRETQEVAEVLRSHPALASKVGVYHGDMSVGERYKVHAAFLRDQLSIVCCTLAFGMGVDKSNVRRVVHYGMPSSLEGYYQQAGRAGRDGLPAKCTLLWSQADAGTHAAIKDPLKMTMAAADTYNSGIASMLNYATTGGCRHAAMVNHFDPGTFKPSGTEGKCTGGCDNCASTGPGAAERQDVTKEAMLMLSVLDKLGGYFGLAKALLILRGSRSKDVRDQWKTWRLRDGTVLWGAGTHKGDEWWKGMSDILMSQGLAAMETRSSNMGRSYAVTVSTTLGKDFLASHSPGPIMAVLTAAMKKEEKWVVEAQQAAEKAQQGDSVVKDEVEKLYRELVQLRQGIAASADIAPTMILSDMALRQVAEKRPSDVNHLRSCEGCGLAFIQRYGAAFVAAINSFCSNSSVLKVGNGWRSARPVTVSSALPPHLEKLLAEPKTAAIEAYRRFSQGETLGNIATVGRPKPINPMTVAGYIADAAGAGVSVDWARLAGEAALTEPLGRQIGAAVQVHGTEGFRAVRQILPDSVEYAQIKIVAGMMARGEFWFSKSQGGEENIDKNNMSCNGSTDAVHDLPDASACGDDGDVARVMKRQRVSEIATPAPSRKSVDADTVLSWLSQNGPATGPQIATTFCETEEIEGEKEVVRRELRCVLAGLMDDYAICRKGGNAATSGDVDLDDGVTLYMAF